MQGTGGFGRCNIATGSVPLPPFLLLLPQSGLRNVSFSSSSIHSIAFFAFSNPPCPALPCPVTGAAASLCSPLYYSRLRIITSSSPLAGHHHPAWSTLHIRRRRRQLPSSQLQFFLTSGTCRLLCCRAGRLERFAIPHLGNPETAASATGAATLWTSIANFFVLSSAVSVHRIRSCHPSPPLSLPLKQGNPSSQKKKGKKTTVPG